jgi:hypothetical protein
MKRLIASMFVAAVAVGVAAGFLTSPPAHAAVGVELYIQPGGTTSTLTCGWHGSPGCPNAGGHQALD